MADIFISYSKVDRLIVEALAAGLEAEGWSVWFDRSLTVGEGFRDRIERELSTARAVIVVWSASSVTSKWVRAEATFADQLNKLLPISASVPHEAIPLPFGEMNIVPIDQSAIIKSAVAAQLTRPAVEMGKLATATASLRQSALAWVGIIGAALTLFQGFKGVIELAAWAQKLVEQWQEWTHFFWHALASIFRFDLPKSISHGLTFISFMAAATRSRGLGIGPSSQAPSLQLANKLSYVLAPIGIAFACWCGAALLGQILDLSHDRSWLVLAFLEPVIAIFCITWLRNL